MTCGPPAPRNETENWIATYGSDVQRRRRRETMPRKLRLLGLERAPVDARILDLCCGTGETLETLYDMGFRHLSGLDLTITAPLASDPRFDVAEGNAASPGMADESFDWILLLHALHHLGGPEQIDRVLAECYRLLKPGGRMGIIDFPNSPQIRLAFWFFRQGVFLWTPYLKYFGTLIREEWPFLKHYLPQFPRVGRLLEHGRFDVERKANELFYFYLTLRKPPASRAPIIRP